MPRGRGLRGHGAPTFALRIGAMFRYLRPAPAEPIRFIRSVYGPELAATPGDRTFELCAYGNGAFVADVIAAHDRPFLFLDIGANLGLFSLLADRNPRCLRVAAFEPLPEVFRTLKANVARNRAAKVEAVCAAVTDRPERFAQLAFNPHHSGMSRIVDHEGPGTVRARTLNAKGLSRRVRPAPGSILVKIDVEGSERAVLGVLRATPFHAAITDIVIEISARNLGQEGRQAVLHALAADGYAEVGREGPEDHYDAHFRRSH